MTEDGPPVDTDRDRDRAEMHQQADVGRDHPDSTACSPGSLTMRCSSAA
ncbi:hypothetical protein ACFQL1_20485 [Halomicroarcula sp. GCM10025709]